MIPTVRKPDDCCHPCFDEVVSCSFLSGHRSGGGTVAFGKGSQAFLTILPDAPSLSLWVLPYMLLVVSDPLFPVPGSGERRSWYSACGPLGM